MKKVFLTLALFSLALVSQAQAISKGESQINLGFGLSGWGVPVYAGYEYGFSNVVSGGIEGSYRNFNENYSSNKYKYTVSGVGVFANYHFNQALNIADPWDVYAGATLGYYNVKLDSDYPGAYASGTSFGGQIGARYYFSKKVGVNLEFNGGSVVSSGKLGLSIKL